MKKAGLRIKLTGLSRFIFILITYYLPLTTYYCFSQQGDTDPYFISGVSKYLEGEYQEAIPLLEKAYESNKKNEKIKDFLLKSLVETGIICVTELNYQNACYYFEKSLKVNPKDKKLQTMHKKIQVLIAETAKQTRNKEHGTDAKLSSGEVSSPAVILRAKPEESQKQDASLSVQQDSKIIETEKRKLMSQHFNKATDLFQKQKYKEAIKEWEEVLKIDPNHQQSKEMIEKAKK